MTSNSTLNGQQLELVSITTPDFQLLRSLSQEELGRKYIKNCGLSKRFDFVWNLRGDKHSHWRHPLCEPISLRNRNKLNPPQRRGKPPVKICTYCKRWDSINTLIKKRSNWAHDECYKIASNNQKKLKTMKEGITHCEITGMKFDPYGKYSKCADHDHETLLYRATITQRLNIMEGCFKDFMKDLGLDYYEVADLVKKLHDRPGVDIGLEPYPDVGYATHEEALEALNEIIN